MTTTNQPKILWQPSDEMIEQAHITQYRRWLQKKYNLTFTSYEDLWAWSIGEDALFWETLLEYFNVAYTGTYEKAVQGMMPDCKWFEGTQLNYAAHVFRQSTIDRPAIYHAHERQGMQSINWSSLEEQVHTMAVFLKSKGVGLGDRVVAYIPNIPEATIAFLACASIGAVWSSCSPDFGLDSVISRFEQIQPKVLIATDGYSYGGKIYDKSAQVRDMLNRLTGVSTVIWIDHIQSAQEVRQDGEFLWRDILEESVSGTLSFEQVPFDHPIFILFSSGTTGVPKAITHGHGGMLLEHLKYLHFHNDVRPGERFFWYSTTGWMMWNFTNAALLCGASIVLYDGSPAYPSMDHLWQMTEEVKINHFGTSAPFIVGNMKRDLRPGEKFDLSSIRSIGSTGSPLPPEAFEYIYKYIHPNVWLCSMSGGTDVCTAFVGGNPLLPVFEGEIQCRALGAAVKVWDEAGQELQDEEGEMIISRPMPCMPVFFWNDPDRIRYKSSYFEEYPGFWRHGDWIRLTPRNGMIIYGRSDATLNRHGVRIGTSEIYSVLNTLPYIEDGLVVNLELAGGQHFMPLFVQMKNQVQLHEDHIKEINLQLKHLCSPRHVPDVIIQVADIPYTISGKKMEAPIKKILLGKDNEKTFNQDAMRNPESIDFFRIYAKERLG
jgi:acetoacetyl-CoA synthetase